MKYKQSSFVNNPSFLTWVSEDAAKSQKWYIMINVKAETAGRFWIGVKILNTAQVGHALIS